MQSEKEIIPNLLVDSLTRIKFQDKMVIIRHKGNLISTTCFYLQFTNLTLLAK